MTDEKVYLYSNNINYTYHHKFVHWIWIDDFFSCVWPNICMLHLFSWSSLISLIISIMNVFWIQKSLDCYFSNWRGCFISFNLKMQSYQNTPEVWGESGFVVWTVSELHALFRPFQAFCSAKHHGNVWMTFKFLWIIISKE